MTRRTRERPDRGRITAGRAVRLVLLATAVVVLVAGPVMWTVDRADFPTLGVAWWWAVQTATTVGYGDVVPRSIAGRAVGALLMVASTAFLALVTAAVTTSLVERVRSRRSAGHDTPTQLAEVLVRLERIEGMLQDDPPPRS